MGSDLEGEVRTESTETIDGPNGVGSIETVSVSVNGIPSMGARGIGVTQGELLRQEQRAGVVPVSQLVPSHHVHSANPHAQVHRRASASASSSESPPTSAAAASATPPSSSPELERKSHSPPSAADIAASHANAHANTTAATPVDADAPVGSVTGTDEEMPHARGPEEIGPEDMGPQPSGGGPSNTGTSTGPNGYEMQGIDVEAAVGRKAAGGRGSSKSPPKPDAESGDKMDIEPGSERPSERGSTPKREAADDLGAEGASKKRKEDSGAASTTGAEGMDVDASAEGEGEGKEQ